MKNTRLRKKAYVMKLKELVDQVTVLSNNPSHTPHTPVKYDTSELNIICTRVSSPSQTHHIPHSYHLSVKYSQTIPSHPTPFKILPPHPTPPHPNNTIVDQMNGQKDLSQMYPLKLFPPHSSLQHNDRPDERSEGPHSNVPTQTPLTPLLTSTRSLSR